MTTKSGEATIQAVGKDLFLIVEGVRVAKRGRPGTPQARTWVPLRPGCKVFDGIEVTVIRHGH